MPQELITEENVEIEATEPARRCGSRNAVVAASTEATVTRAVTWAKVTAPRPWHPAVGDELVGYYAGRTMRDGKFGQYEVVMVAVPGAGVVTVSGVKALSAIDASGVQLRTPVKFVFNGKRDVAGREHQMNDIDVYVDAAFLEPITELPEIAS